MYLDAKRWLTGLVKATIRARPLMKIWQWIDRHVSIPVIVGSPNPGPMRTERFPVYRALYEILQLPQIHFFTFCASARTGKTLLSICYLLWRISEKLGPVLWLDPTRKTATRFVRQELEPFIRECRPVWEKAIVSKTAWTLLEKQFRGLQLRIVGSGSVADLAGYQAELVVINESDRVRAVVDREAASADLAIERSKQFESTRMILRNSTPTREDGDIWQNFLRGSRLYCYIRCPHCIDAAGDRRSKASRKKRRNPGLQRLTFWSETVEVPFDEDGFPLPAGELRAETTGRVRFDQFKQTEKVETEPGKWEERERGYDLEAVRSSATYECAWCKKDIEHHEMNGLLADAQEHLHAVFAELRAELEQGKFGDLWNRLNAKMAASKLNCIWLAHNVKAPVDHGSAHLSALYSPFERWGAIAVKFLQARGNLSKLVSLYTLDLGIPFVHQAAAVRESDIDRLINRCPKKYLKRQLPFRPEFLTMTVDVQGYQFWWSIRAHGILWDHPDQPFWSALIDWGEAVSWEQIEEFAALRRDKQGKRNVYLWREDDGQITEFQVTAGLVDSGFEAQENKNVYDFCTRWSEVFSPSKGGDESKTRGATVRLSPIMNDSMDLVWYWDSFWKQGLYQHCVRLGMNGAGEPEYWWVPSDVDQDYRIQLCNEHLEEKNGKRQWATKGPNHLADTEKMHLVLRDTIWEQLEAIRDERMKAEDKKGGDASND